MKKIILLFIFPIFLLGQSYTKLVPQNNTDSDDFGRSVSISGSYIAVGSPNTSSKRGAVYIFHLSNGNWQEQQVITLNNAQEDEYFGYSVKILGDVLVCSAPGRNNGEVYVYVRVNANWQQADILNPSSGNKFFGTSLYLTDRYLLVGQNSSMNDGIEGTAVIFEYSGQNFIYKDVLVTNDLYDNSGEVAIAMNGTDILMGVPNESEGSNWNAGAVYYFVKNGSTWSLEKRFVYGGFDPHDPANEYNSYFGRSVCLNGNLIVIGDNGWGNNEGAAFVFNKSGDYIQKIAYPYDVGTNFGWSINLDGDNLIIGSNPVGDLPGYVRILEFDGQQFVEKNEFTEAVVGDFGVSVEVDNNNYVIGNPSKYSNGKGEVYYFGNLVSDVKNEKELPDSYVLTQNYPNPFNPSTSINYSLPKSGFVSVSIYDVNGELVQTLVSGDKIRGDYSIHFNADNLSSGIYFYQIKTNDFSSTKKMILLK